MSRQPKKGAPVKSNLDKNIPLAEPEGETKPKIPKPISVVFNVLGIFGITTSLYLLPIPLVHKLYIVIGLSAMLIFFKLIFKDKDFNIIFWPVIILFTLGVGIWGWYARKEYRAEILRQEQLTLLDQRKTPLFIESDERFKILILPFQYHSNQEENDAGNEISQGLILDNNKENVDDTVVYAKQLYCLNPADSAQQLKDFHHANLILFGTFYPAQGIDSSKIKLNWISDDNYFLAGLTTQTDALPKTTSLADLNRGEILGDVKFVIQFLISYVDFSKGNYSKAIDRLKKNENYAIADKADLLLGLVYIKAGDNLSAIEFLRKCISIDKDNKDAHLFLSVAYWYDENYNDAFNELEYLIRQYQTYEEAYALRGAFRTITDDVKGAMNDYTEAIKLSPNYESVYINRGKLKEYLKDYEGAIADYSKVIELNPKDTTTYSNLGHLKYSLKDYQGAIDDYSKIIEIDPNNAIALNNRGDAKVKKECYQDALVDLSKAIEIDPNNYHIYFNRGQCKRNLNDNEGAVLDFSKCIELNPKYAIAYSTRGEIKLGNGDYKGAIEDYSILLEIEPDNTLAYVNRGAAKCNIGNFNDAISDFSKAVSIDSNDWDARFNLGFAKFELKNYQEAISDLSYAIIINPNKPEAYIKRGHCKYKNNDYQGAITDLSKAIDINPQILESYLIRANAKEKINDFDGAILDWTKIIETEPQNLAAIHNRGVAKLNAKYYQDAISDFSKVLEKKNKYMLAYQNRGLAYMHSGQFDNAISDFSKLSNTKSNDYSFYPAIGYMYLQQNNVKLAMEYSKRCLDKNFKSFYANLNLSLIYYIQGDKEKSKSYLDTAQAIEPRLKEGMNGILKLESEWFYWTDKDKEILRKMLDEFK